MKKLFPLFLKRLFFSLLILFLMITILFFLLRVAPGDPSQKFISPELSPELAERVKESFNLNESPGKQYLSFIANIFKGDFGISYTYRIPVLDVIKEYLPFTIIFSIISFHIQILFAFFLAIKGINNKGGFLDSLLSKLSIAVYALPSFVLGVVLIFFFSELINLFPSSGLKSYDYESYSYWQKFLDLTWHMILPLITLSLSGAAVFYKYLRDNFEEIYNKNFILNLRANGFSEKEIILKHVIPNAAGPLISIAGIELGILLSGALITEVIFGLPGMGRLTITAILLRDYPIVIAATFFAGFMVILSNLAADIAKAKVDKRLLKGI